MEYHPYTALVKMVREDADKRIPVIFREGKVMCVSPLKIEVANTIQQNVFRQNADLKDIKVGDTLLMISESDQRFIILCKVVGA